MKRALVTGITGQDGSYLAEFLLAKGYEVHGVKRRTSLFNTARIDHLYDDPHVTDSRFKLHYGDLTDSSALIRVVQTVQPDEIYNLAAQSHVKVSFEEPEYTANSDGLGTLRLLEAIRILGLEKKTRFYQASTSELYGLVQEIPQRETTPFYPRSPYAVAKLYAYWITVNYREAYGMYACNGILYLGNLDALRDWGHARDYVEMQWLMLQQECPKDYVIATGEQHSVRELIDLAARYLNLELVWEGQGVNARARNERGEVVVAVDPRYFRPTEVETLLGDASRAQVELGWTPATSFQELIREMVTEDYAAAEKEALIREHGYPAYECCEA